ncbi:MAG: hypothetical protein L0Z52_02135 [Acidobacteria bacterium]|nr:hypothetical protein [Acidobacteriota bacterium]
MANQLRSVPILILLALVAGDSVAQTYVKIRDDVVIHHPDRTAAGEKAQEPTPSADINICNLRARAWHGQAIVTGGTLNPVAFANPAIISSSGRIAFMARVDGIERNQGIFVVDDLGLAPIVTGCGGGGGSGDPGTGCGDPSPIGGTFSGFFGGTVFAPDINTGGDMLFLADVQNASAPRGLFLYHAASKEIMKIAAVGDPSPVGGTFGAVGPGSINNGGTIVFLASKPGMIESDIFRWRDGVVTKIAAVGDPVPGGGVFTYLGSEAFGFLDGSVIPTGPVPDINDSGQVSFRGIVSGGLAERGLFVSTGGVHNWTVKAGDPTPAGGAYVDFFAPVINGSGEIAFFAHYQTSPGTFSSGWFAGSTGGWRKALAFLDSVDDGQVYGLAVSRNPLQPLDDQGRVLVWCDLNPNSGEERLVISSPDGSLAVASRQGDPTPLGGQTGTMQAWPSMRNARGTLSAGTPGAPNGTLTAHFVLQAGLSEVTGVSALQDAPSTGDIMIAWDSQDGSAGFGTNYDVVRGTLDFHTSGFPGGAACVANDLPDTPYSEAAGACPAVVGDGCWYLVRAQSACDTGTYGPPALDTASPCP